MIFSKLKISTKLLISSGVFLVPIGVMLFFICSINIGTIQNSIDEYDGIRTLRPVVRVMQALPEYLNVQLGLEQGNLRALDEQISGHLRTLDREVTRYETERNELSGLLSGWENLKRIDSSDDGFFQAYLDFTFLLTSVINRIGERAGLMLVSDMRTYYLVASALSGIPEAYIRLMTVGSILRESIHDADALIDRWNADLADAQTLGRRMGARPFDRDPRDITMTMLPSADLQLIRNSRILFESDRTQISSSLRSAMDTGRAGRFEELAEKLEQYQNSMDILFEQYGRISGFGVANVITAADFFTIVSQLNTYLCQLWDESFIQLELRVQRNTVRAQWQLVIYLALVLISLGLAVGFVMYIMRDINRSVKSLNTLFKGLNENDLTLSLPIHSGDEFGELMTAFNGFVNVLRSTFGSFKQSTQLVADSVFDISSSSKEITTTANQQSASVSEIVSTMEGSKNLSEQIAIKTTEVANLAKETQDLSGKGAEISEANLDMMEGILKQNQKIISEIRNLSDMIVKISEAIRIIDSIADQTKLIAFNASLEASSSGEAGARFSVVASEIRRFADNVVESTNEIKQKIEEVQDASQTLIGEANSGSRQIQIGYERMSDQIKEFGQIVDNSQNVATRSQQISNLSKQQEIASSQIFTALKEISAGVKQFVIATSSTSRIADSLNGMSEELKGKVGIYRTEIEG